MVCKLCIYWTKYADNGLFTFIDEGLVLDPNTQTVEQFGLINYCIRACFGCILNYFLKHQQTYVLSKYSMIQYSLRLMRKREATYSKYHARAISMCE